MRHRIGRQLTPLPLGIERSQLIAPVESMIGEPAIVAHVMQEQLHPELTIETLAPVRQIRTAIDQQITGGQFQRARFSRSFQPQRPGTRRIRF